MKRVLFGAFLYRISTLLETETRLIVQFSDQNEMCSILLIQVRDPRATHNCWAYKVDHLFSLSFRVRCLQNFLCCSNF